MEAPMVACKEFVLFSGLFFSISSVILLSPYSLGADELQRNEALASCLNTQAQTPAYMLEQSAHCAGVVDRVRISMHTHSAFIDQPRNYSAPPPIPTNRLSFMPVSEPIHSSD
jgi:hypothetical protein